MSPITSLLARNEDENTSYSSTTVTLLIVLLVVIIFALLAVIGFMFMRYRRRSRNEQTLPLHNAQRPSSCHRRVTVRPSESVYVYQEKQSLLETSDAPPSAAVPEIRIHFPDEIDNVGKRKSGQVVVVHVGETSIGLEPYSNELPSYQTSESERFQSLDLDSIGGLKEKDFEAHRQ